MICLRCNISIRILFFIKFINFADVKLFNILNNLLLFGIVELLIHIFLIHKHKFKLAEYNSLIYQYYVEIIVIVLWFECYTLR